MIRYRSSVAPAAVLSIISPAFNSPLWYGAKGDGVTDDTSAWAAALAAGGLINGGGLSYAVSNLILTTDFARVRDAKFIAIAATTGTWIAIDADDCALEDCSFDSTATAALANAVRMRDGDRFTFRHNILIGDRWSMRLPRTSFDLCTPLCQFRAQKTSGAPQYGGVYDDNIVIGGQLGANLFNQSDGHANNWTSSYTASSGMNIGSGASSRNFTVANYRALRCGLFAISNATQLAPYITTAGLSPDPYLNNRIINAYAEGCGHLETYAGFDGGIGGTKFAFDITGGGTYGQEISARAINCAAGGAEFKGYIATTLYPSGRKDHKIDLHVTTNFSAVGAAILTDEADAGPSTFLSDFVIGGMFTAQPPPAWLAGMWSEPTNVRQSNAYTWLCAGNSFGEGAFNGATAPTGGHVPVRIATSGGSKPIGTTTFTFADTTGVAVGDRVFTIGAANAVLMSDSLTVTSLNGGTTDVTLSGACTAAVPDATLFYFVKEHDDGVNLWYAKEAVPAVPFGTGLDIRASTNVVVDGFHCFNTKYCWPINAIDSLTGAATNVSIDGVARDCTFAVYLQGAGNITCSFTRRSVEDGSTTPITIVAGGTRVLKKPALTLAPVSKVADFTVDNLNDDYINNKTAAATCTVTLPTASEWPGRRLRFLNYKAFTVVSAASDVVPLAGGAAGTAMIAATPGLSIVVQSDGTNWVAMP